MEIKKRASFVGISIFHIQLIFSDITDLSAIFCFEEHAVALVLVHGFDPDARKFLKFLYKSSREQSCWEIGSGQPQIQFTWSTLFASAYWDMRLSMAYTAMSAEVVG
jgi:hypothetical protein